MRIFVRVKQHSDTIMAKLVSANLMGDKLCTLTYTTTDGEMLSFARVFNAFDAKIISHTYTDKGVIIFDKPITIISIEQLAFTCRSRITSITIPDSVISFGWRAFAGCCNLKTFYGKFSSDGGRCLIKEGSFVAYAEASGCSYNIPNSVTSIGARAFSNCKSLISITIPDRVTSIGMEAFYGCSSLTSITIPDSVTSIGTRAFEDCYSLTSITIPDSVTAIGPEAFNDCRGELIINSKIVEVDTPCILDRNEEDCSSCSDWLKGSYFSTIVIGDNINHIGSRTFCRYKSLADITIPTSVISIKDCAFLGCNGLKSVHISDLSAWCKIDFASNPLAGASLYLQGEVVSKLIIPEGTTLIGKYAFAGCSGLTSVSIPNSVTIIDESAFNHCVNLKDVIIPNSVLDICDFAFYDCRSLECVHISDISAWCRINFGLFANPISNDKATLYINKSPITELVIPDGVSYIGSGAFRCYENFKSATIPNSVTSIGMEAFYGCSSLTSITIPDSVTYIGEYAFSYCKNLTKIIVNGGNIGSNAFKSCDNLTDVTLGGSVNMIGVSAFENCCNLSRLTMIDGVFSIESAAFKGCCSLSDVTIPDSVTNIKNDVFCGCSNLTSLTIGKGVSLMGSGAISSSVKDIFISDISAWCRINFEPGLSSHFNDNTNLYLNGKLVTELIVPNDVVEIGAYAFKNYANLTSVTIPNSVNSIGYNAFNECQNLSKVVIEKGVSNIACGAFENCANLTSITIPSSLISIEMYAFHKCKSLSRVDIQDVSSWCKISFANKESNPLHIGAKLYLNNSELTNIVIPSDISKIKPFAFIGYKTLTSVTIPDSITMIGAYAFCGCESLSHIVIGKNVAEVADLAFYDCNIDTIICQPLTPPKLSRRVYESYGGEYRFAMFSNIDTIVVPVGCEEAYLNSDWGVYITGDTIPKWLPQQFKEEDYDNDNDDDTEYESYLALGGDPEKYESGCLDDYMDSIGL